MLPTTEPDAYGPTRNPWNTDHSTGGCSGGSAAAVASGMVAAGHANDGGGSIRIPASECGLVGLKPTRGRVSLAPDFGDVMGGLVAEFVVTRTVRDSARLLDSVAGPGQVIGVDDVEPPTWALSEMGRGYSAPDWLSSREWLQVNARAMAAWWRDPAGDALRSSGPTTVESGHVLLVTPTIAEPPPRLGEFASPPDNPVQGLFRAAVLVPFTPPFNVSGQPAISLPLHQNEGGLPIGVQFVAAMGGEDLLLRVASQLETAAPLE